MFLEGFILPNVTKTKEEEEEEAEKIEFFQLPSEIIDPRTGDRLKKANAAKASSSKITESAVERLPGEFRIPIIPYGHVVVPGARVKMNLFEPRWLTLFSKLLKPEDAEEDRRILTSHQWGVLEPRKRSILAKLK